MFWNELTGRANRRCFLNLGAAGGRIIEIYVVNKSIRFRDENIFGGEDDRERPEMVDR